MSTPLPPIEYEQRLFAYFDILGETPFFLEVSKLIHRLIKLGRYVRGSIVVGSLFHNQSVIVGPALVRAVDLEKLAIYPRIIIHKSVFEHFRREGVVQSEDGFLALDWLWYLYEDNNLNNAGKDADQILQIVEQKIIEDGQDERLLMKHLWMKSYLRRFTKMASFPSP